MNVYRRMIAAPFAASVLIAGVAATDVAAQNTTNSNSNRTGSTSQRQGTTKGTVGSRPNSASGTSSYSAADRALIQSLSARLTPTEQRTFSQMLSRLSTQERQVLLKVTRGGSYGAGTSGINGGTGTGTDGATGTGNSTGTGTGNSTGTGTGSTGTGTGTGTGSGTGSGSTGTGTGTGGGGTTP